MQDLSTVAVCLLFSKNCNTAPITFNYKDKYCTIFPFSAVPDGKSELLTCTLGKVSFDSIFPTINRKTEIGNRILTLTALELHGIHTVHFSECKDMLNIQYSGKHISRNSSFKKSADIAIAEQTASNCFEINYYENKTGSPRPTLSAFCATAAAACKNGYTKYNDEVRVCCGSSAVFVTCSPDGEVTIQFKASKIFEGKLNHNFP